MPNSVKYKGRIKMFSNIQRPNNFPPMYLNERSNWEGWCPGKKVTQERRQPGTQETEYLAGKGGKGWGREGTVRAAPRAQLRGRPGGQAGVQSIWERYRLDSKIDTMLVRLECIKGDLLFGRGFGDE